MKHWINTRVRLNDSWGPGSIDSLTTPLGQQPEFALHPRHLRDSKGERQLAHFGVDFPSGYLADGWQGVNFVPMGKDPVTGISGLPAWHPSQRDTYRKAIDDASAILGNSNTQRLEAVIPFLGKQGGIGYNKVRLFYVFNAVQGPVPDLVVVKTLTHVGIPGTVQARQEGGGQGPPDPH